MAVNPLIALQGRVPDVGNTFTNALTNIARFDAIKQGREQAPVRNRLLEAQTATTEAAVPTAVSQLNVEDVNKIRSIATGARSIIGDLQAGNNDRVLATLQNRKAELTGRNIDTTDTDEAISLIQSNPGELMRLSVQAIGLDDKLTLKGVKTTFGAQQTFKDTAGNLFFGTTKRQPSGGGAVETVLAPIGNSPKEPVGQISLVSNLGQTAAEKQATAISTKAGEEEVVLKVRKKFKPLIESAITKARLKAKEEGETFNDVRRLKASLPGLTSVVNELKELAPLVTSTFGGRVFDVAIKESGFGSTKGSTARAKFIAIINNQVLPLLKQTFGGSFSIQEGQELKASMGDPNSTSDEKIAQLNAFIAQKARTIESKEAQLQGVNNETSQNITPVGKMTDEELQIELNKSR